MKLIAGALLALMLSTVVASAACPLGTRYMCYPTANGKQACGCYR